MLRTILVVVAGLILSFLLVSATTAFMLSHTEFGRLMTGDSSGMSDRWHVFESGERILFFYTSLPTVLFTALFVVLLAKESAVLAAAVAVVPVSLLSSGLELRGAWRSLVLLLCAVLLAGLCQRLRLRLARSNLVKTV